MNLIFGVGCELEFRPGGHAKLKLEDKKLQKRNNWDKI